jgi:hypothetical protein
MDSLAVGQAQSTSTMVFNHNAAYVAQVETLAMEVLSPSGRVTADH